MIGQLKDNEKWIEGFEYFYSIDRDANITSWDDNGERKLILKHVLQNTGYTTVCLSKLDFNSGHKTKLVQTIMKKAFMMDSKPSDKHVLTHNDRNFRNNKLSNLRWELRSKISKKEGAGRGKKPVTVTDLVSGEIFEYPCTVSASKGMKTRASLIKEYNDNGEPYRERYLIHQHKSLKA